MLNEIGLLWQTSTITPAHEHFLVAFIRQKIILNIEIIQSQQTAPPAKTFVLFLPDNEIHELGLMFINHELISMGHRCIFLGLSVPKENLTDLVKYYDDITFISYFTIKPEKEEINTYIEDFNNLIIKPYNSKLWILGQMTKYLDTKKLPKNISAFNSIKSIIKELA